MGASNSAPRTLTMKNEEPHIIEVTSDVINRIKHGYHLPQSQQQPPPSSSENATSQTTATATDTAITNQGLLERFTEGEDVAITASASNEVNREKVVLSVGASGHEVLETVSALQVRKEKDEQLAANDLFWRTKIKELEARYVESAFDSERAYQTEMAHMQKLMPKRQPAVCDDVASKVTACYAANPKQVLKCSEIVKEFGRCVDSKLGQTLNA